MRTILHVGTHKTGTTTIQHFAFKNARKLRMRGLLYPSYDMIGLKRRYAHHDFSHAVAEIPNANLSLQQAKDFVAAIAERAETEMVLLSGEPIYRHILSVGGDYWAEREAYIARLSEVTAPLRPEILIVLRRQDDFARSLYQENVKSNNVSSDFKTFIKDKYYYYTYLEQIELFRKYFHKVNIVIFEDLVAEGKLLRDFFHWFGIKLGKMGAVPDLNESLPMDLVEFKRLLNACSLTKQQSAVVSRTLLELSARKEQFPKRANCDWISADEMAAFMAQFEASNARVLDMMDTKPARETLFPPARVRGEVYSGLTPEQIMSINGQLLRKLLQKIPA